MQLSYARSIIIKNSPPAADDIVHVVTIDSEGALSCCEGSIDPLVVRVDHLNVTKRRRLWRREGGVTTYITGGC